jgi:hypothetical protein
MQKQVLEKAVECMVVSENIHQMLPILCVDTERDVLSSSFHIG